MPAGLLACLLPCLLHLLKDLGESDSCLGGSDERGKKSMGQPAKLLWEMMKKNRT